MPAIDPTRQTAASLKALLESGDVTAEEVASAYLDRADRLEPSLHAFLHRDAESALTKAREIDARRKAGAPLGPLAGIPIAIKDVLCAKGVPTTCGSRMLRDFRPPYDATVIKMLDAAGAISVGKTNMDEFAMGSSTENSAYRSDPEPVGSETRVPGVAPRAARPSAVAAGLAPLALGFRHRRLDPAAGRASAAIVGLKPTYGPSQPIRPDRLRQLARPGRPVRARPGRHGSPPRRDRRARSQWTRRASTNRSPTTARPLRTRPPKSLRVGVVREFFGAGLDAEVAGVGPARRSVVYEAVRRDHQGSLPASLEIRRSPAYYIVATGRVLQQPGPVRRHDLRPPRRRLLAPVSRARRSIRPHGEDDDGQSRRGLRAPRSSGGSCSGTFALSAGYADQYYNQALKVRRLIRNDFDAAFGEVDVLIGPTTPTPAFRLGEKTSDPLTMYLSDIYTITTNLAGIPALSIPCGLSKSGLPIGLQLLAPAFAEETPPRRGPRLRTRDRLARETPRAGMMADHRAFTTFGESRSDLAKAATDRLDEAHALLDGGHWASAIAMGIYALEIRLKVMICDHLRLPNLPRAMEFHAIDDLMILTGLYERIKLNECSAKASWREVLTRSRDLNAYRYAPATRYTSELATTFFSHLEAPDTGVLPWLLIQE